MTPKSRETASSVPEPRLSRYWGEKLTRAARPELASQQPSDFQFYFLLHIYPPGGKEEQKPILKVSR